MSAAWVAHWPRREVPLRHQADGLLVWLPRYKAHAIVPVASTSEEVGPAHFFLQVGLERSPAEI